MRVYVLCVRAWTLLRRGPAGHVVVTRCNGRKALRKRHFERGQFRCRPEPECSNGTGFITQSLSSALL